MFWILTCSCKKDLTNEGLIDFTSTLFLVIIVTYNDFPLSSMVYTYTILYFNEPFHGYELGTESD